MEKEKVPFTIKCYGTTQEDREERKIDSISPINVIGYVVTGSGKIELQDKTMNLRAGDSYLIRTNTDYVCQSTSEETWTRIWVEVSGNIVNPILDSYGLKQSMSFSGVSAHDYIKQIHDTAITFSNAELSMEQCCDIFVKMCQYIRRQLLVSNKENVSPQDIAVLKEYMDTHLHEHLSLEKYSQMVSLSVSQTIRKFRAVYGMPPGEYLNSKRIETAKKLLIETKYSIQAISESLGFQDPYYFSKCFKKRCGKSPNSFRKEMQENKKTTT